MTELNKMRTVLITGGAGFIGSHLCEVLLFNNWRVIAVDNFISGTQQNVASFVNHPYFSLIEADVTKPVNSWLPQNTRLDAILHFASLASPPLYQKHPLETIEVNTVATKNLLEYLFQNSPQGTFLFAGTSEVYGDPLVHPQPESYWGNVNPNGVRSCYDESKRLGETLCGEYYRQFGLDTRIVRIFNTYGPRMHPQDGRIIPNLIMAGLNREPLPIYGDGSQTRSYCYVDDLVSGIMTFLTKPNLAGETINLGNPEEFSALETGKIIWQLINPNQEMKVHYHPLPKDDPSKRRPDITKANKLLDWNPKISFEEGVSKTISYFNQPSLKPQP